MNVQDLIEKYQKRLKELINPDDLTWEDFNEEGPIDGYDSIEAFIRENEENTYNEGQQEKMRCIEEFLEDLQELLKEEQRGIGGSAPHSSNKT